MNSSLTILLLCLLAVYHQAKAQTGSPLIGRPDGHEPEAAKTVPGLLGRPDGHELGSQEDASEDTDADKPILGQHDGHEPGIEAEIEESEDGSDELMDDFGEGDENADDNEEGNDEDYYGLTLSGELDSNSKEPASDEEDQEDGDEPLVRCKRPLCFMYCENGFQSDASGCPVCRCKDSESSLIGRPDGHEPGAVDCGIRPMCAMICENGFKSGDDGCPVCECAEATETNVPGHQNGSEPIIECPPLCRMFCRLGFKTDERGCQVCSCLEDPCQGVVCESGSECQSQPCEDSKSCTQLSAKCVATPKSRPCPEPMCANACPYGYAKNEAGCMTCTCDSIPAERVCGPIKCDEGLICRNGTDGSSKCSVKSICETRRSLPVGLGGAQLLCERDGSFKSLQCNPKLAECWCVDGLGQEVEDSRVTVYVEEHKPKCARNITVSMRVHMTLIVKHDIDISDELDSLNATIVDHVSSWLLIEPRYIKVAKAESVSSNSQNEKDSIDDSEADDETELADDYNSVDEDELGGSSLLLVELVVVHDGQSDLPSAANYMQRRMHLGQCDIPVGRGTLLPNPYSLKTEHQFAHQPVYPESEYNLESDYEPSWRCWRGVRVGLCAFGVGLFILVVITLSLALHRRRHRMHMLQFKHQRLDSQTSVEKDFLNHESEKSVPTDHDAYMTKDEKHPIA